MLLCADSIDETSSTIKDDSYNGPRDVSLSMTDDNYTFPKFKKSNSNGMNYIA